MVDENMGNAWASQVANNVFHNYSNKDCWSPVNLVNLWHYRHAWPQPSHTRAGLFMFGSAAVVAGMIGDVITVCHIDNVIVYCTALPYIRHNCGARQL